MEELAALDAGLLTDDEEQRLRSRIACDPGAVELLAALEQVRTDLGRLADEPVPDDVAARIDAALAEAAACSDSTNAPTGAPVTPAAPDPETPKTAPVVDLAAVCAGGRTGARRGRTGRSRMQRWAVAGLSVAAAAVVTVVVVGIVRSTMQTQLPQPGDSER